MLYQLLDVLTLLTLKLLNWKTKHSEIKTSHSEFEMKRPVLKNTTQKHSVQFSEKKRLKLETKAAKGKWNDSVEMNCVARYILTMRESPVYDLAIIDWAIPRAQLFLDSLTVWFHLLTLPSIWHASILNSQSSFSIFCLHSLRTYTVSRSSIYFL